MVGVRGLTPHILCSALRAALKHVHQDFSGKNRTSFSWLAKQVSDMEVAHSFVPDEVVNSTRSHYITINVVSYISATLYSPR